MVSEKLVELKILLRRACMCEGEGNRKSTMNLKTKVLYLLAQGAKSPGDVISTLCVAKPNVTTLTNALESEGLIEKARGQRDRREVSLSITPAGQAYLRERLDLIEKGFGNILTTKAEYDKAVGLLDEVIDLLSFLG